MLIMHPPSFLCFAVACVATNTARTLTPNVGSNSSVIMRAVFRSAAAAWESGGGLRMCELEPLRAVDGPLFRLALGGAAAFAFAGIFPLTTVVA